MNSSDQSGSLKLEKDEVHLWNVNFELAPTTEMLQCLVHFFSAEELNYSATCIEKRKREFLISRFALRTLLSNYFPLVSPAAWQFSKTSFGKPVVIGPITIFPLQFNISHSNNRAVVAFSLTEALGVDLEHIRKFRTLQSTAESCFSADEIKMLMQADSSKVAGLFFEFWTLKESFVKALGEGLSFPTEKLTFHIPASSPEKNLTGITVHIADSTPTADGFWTFKLLNPHSDYQAAVSILSRTKTSIKLIECGTFSNWNMVPAQRDLAS